MQKILQKNLYPTINSTENNLKKYTNGKTRFNFKRY